MNKQLRLMIITAMFTALTAIFILTFKIPVGNGIIHIGDSIIYLAACILPFPYGLIAAGLGGAFANIFGGYVMWAPATLIIKALITLPYNSKSDKILTKRNIFMVVPAGIITIIGYFIACCIIFDPAAAFGLIPGDVIQAGGSAALFIVFASALDNVKFKQLILSNNAEFRMQK